MSKTKDRERAESGFIFRNGELISKRKWNALLKKKAEKTQVARPGTVRLEPVSKEEFAKLKKGEPDNEPDKTILGD